MGFGSLATAFYSRQLITEATLNKSHGTLNPGKSNMRYFNERLLGSNDPNTIPDPTRIRCSRFRIVLYVSARTPFCLDLATFYVSSDSVLSG